MFEDPGDPGSETFGTETPGTETVGRSTFGTETLGTFTFGTETLGTSTLGTFTFGTSTLGTSTFGTSTFGTSTLGTSTFGTSTSGTSGIGTLGTWTSGSAGALGSVGAGSGPTCAATTSPCTAAIAKIANTSGILRLRFAPRPKNVNVAPLSRPPLIITQFSRKSHHPWSTLGPNWVPASRAPVVR